MIHVNFSLVQCEDTESFFMSMKMVQVPKVGETIQLFHPQEGWFDDGYDAYLFQQRPKGLPTKYEVVDVNWQIDGSEGHPQFDACINLKELE